MGPPPPPPPIPHHETIPITAPLIASIQTRIDTRGNGTTRVSSAPASRRSFRFELGEGLDKSADARNHGL